MRQLRSRFVLGCDDVVVDGDVMCYRSFFFFQAEDGIRDAQESRGLGDVYKRQGHAGDRVRVNRKYIGVLVLSILGVRQTSILSI